MRRRSTAPPPPLAGSAEVSRKGSDVGNAEQSAETIRQQIEEMNTGCEAEVAALGASAPAIDSFEIKPTRTGTTVRLLASAGSPYEKTKPVVFSPHRRRGANVAHAVTFYDTGDPSYHAIRAIGSPAGGALEPSGRLGRLHWNADCAGVFPQRSPCRWRRGQSDHLCFRAKCRNLYGHGGVFFRQIPI